jgi:hypothetical protein
MSLFGTFLPSRLRRFMSVVRSKTAVAKKGPRSGFSPGAEGFHISTQWILGHYPGTGDPVDKQKWGTHMRKIALVLAATLAACFTLTGAEAAKKKAKPPADAAYEWNVKNIKPMAAPATATPAKAANKSKKKKAKKS